MATVIQDLITTVRATPLIETTAKFWSDDELLAICIRGIKDLWRDIADLKQEHYLTTDITNVSLQPNQNQLTGVPQDVHKIYMIEPRDLSENGANHGLLFMPMPYNNNQFQLARSRGAMEPTNDTIYYALAGAGAPVSAPTIVTAPKVTSQVLIAFTYVPVLPNLIISSSIPIPGEADNALAAWITAFARAKEREDRSPDPAWLNIYQTEKLHLLQSLGLRQYQEAEYATATFSEYW